jgi:hypothetical protein
MKKIILALAVMAGVSMSAQDKTQFISINASIPMAHAANPYPSIEFGHVIDDVQYSLVFGRGDFDKIFSHKDMIKDYFVEYKIVPTTSIWKLTFGGIVGAGTYLGHSDKSNNKRQPFFGEIGSVVTYNIKPFGVSVSFTNWDGVNYLTPSITYNY